MRRILNFSTAITLSELRGIVLVILGGIALGYYYSWWFSEGRLASPWLVLGLIAAIFYGGFQIVSNWVLYLATHHRSTPPTPPVVGDLSVDVFVTACGEDPALIERALAAACAMRGNHRTWLLDDGHDPALANLAESLGAGYLTRTGRKDAKAGNINAGLSCTDGDVVVIFDIDHAPEPDFLERTLGYFADPKLGFVQVMLTFANARDGWVALAAAESAMDFYNPTSIGADGMSGASLMGSNALIRRQALESIGGYQPGLAEDLATSISIHAAGWHSVYVREPLAPGLAPPDLPAWFAQQLKWARGVFELFLTAYPRYFFRLRAGQRVSYAVRMTYYWVGPVIFTHLLVTLFSLIQSSGAALEDFQQYLIHLLPLAMMTLLIRLLALRRWRHHSLQRSLQMKPIALVFATWPIYTLAWLMAVLRLPLAFRPTPKAFSGGLNPLWLIPQLASIVLLSIGLVYSLLLTRGSLYPIAHGFAAAQIIAQVLILPYLIVTVAKTLARASARPGAALLGQGSAISRMKALRASRNTQ